MNLDEQFLLACSSYNPVDTEVFQKILKQLSPGQCLENLKHLIQGHQLHAYPWFHLKEMREKSSHPLFSWAQTQHQMALMRDLCLEALLPEIDQILQGCSVSYVFVKGPVVHRRIYQDRPLPRGSADMDILIFGGWAAMQRAVDAASENGFVFCSIWEMPSWQAEYEISHQILLMRPHVSGWDIRLELHRSPSCFHLGGKDSQTLMQWLQNQCVEYSWKYSDNSAALPLPTLNPSATLVYLVINLLKDGSPTIRNINDIALLLTHPTDTIDWDQVQSICSKTGMTPALTLALNLVRDWRGVELPYRERLPRYVDYTLSTSFKKEAILNWPLHGDRGAGTVLVFGSRAMTRTTLRYLKHPQWIPARVGRWSRRLVRGQ